MELTVRPDDLYAASAALAGCAARLDSAGLAFARRAQADLADVGAKAADAAGRGVVETEQAVELLTADVRQLAHALAELAHHYPRVDATAVPHR